MLRNVVFDPTNFFYPYGNTPAVCLTQDLPPEQDADILLLGCGDARSILFTAWAQLGPTRAIDFTCCDIEPAVIARNILLFTLIVDDEKNEQVFAIWDIYYHVRIDEKAKQLLSSQAAKLFKYASSVATWNASQYGKLIRFCDHGTLDHVRRIWVGAISEGLSRQQEQARTKTLRAAVDRAQKVKKSFMGDHISMTCVRSAAPAGVHVIKDFLRISKHYWQHGTLYEDATRIASASHPNPTLLSTGDRELTLHYGSDPLLGFPVATAYTPLRQSRLQPQKTSTNIESVLTAAQAQFSAWATSFRAIATRTVVRMFVGDALAFAHALQYLSTNKGTNRAELYRNSWTFEPLCLDGGDYDGSISPPAPANFDVIDTSNLVDHLGALNIIVATAPLLVSLTASTLHGNSCSA